MTKTQRTLALRALLQLVTSGTAAQTDAKPPRKGPGSARDTINELRKLRVMRSA